MRTWFVLSLLIMMNWTSGVPGGFEPKTRYQEADLPENRSDLWILSGQSNACGRGPLPGPVGVPGVRMFDPATGAFVTAEDPLPGMNTEGVGPWVAAAQRVEKTGQKIDLVGFARGGRPISFWDPGEPGNVQLLPRIERAGKGAGLFLWYQGEGDTATAELVAGYQAKLTELVARVRKAAGNPEMTVVIVQLGPNTRNRPKDRMDDYMGLREAQRQFVLADSNALLVPALGRPLKDGVHLATEGYSELGEEIGRAILRTRYGRNDVDWPGPILENAVLGGDGSSVKAYFEEVSQLSGVNVGDFAVVDGQGPVVCSEAKAGAATVDLVLNREVSLPARLIYAYGDGPRATLVDEAGNHAPAVQIEIQDDPRTNRKPK